jgi:hypothetical protein
MSSGQISRDGAFLLVPIYFYLLSRGSSEHNEPSHPSVPSTATMGKHLISTGVDLD